MTSSNFQFHFTTPKKINEVFGILLDVNQWWTGLYNEKVTGKSNQLNDEFLYSAGDGVHFSKHELVTLIPDKKITWLITESNLSFLKKTDEWNDTKIGFELEQINEGTKVTFVHEGLVPEIECYGACSNAWTQYLVKLKEKLKK